MNRISLFMFLIALIILLYVMWLCLCFAKDRRNNRNRVQPSNLVAFHY
jgi:hypothetical protein